MLIMHNYYGEAATDNTCSVRDVFHHNCQATQATFQLLMFRWPPLCSSNHLNSRNFWHSMKIQAWVAI